MHMGHGQFGMSIFGQYMNVEMVLNLHAMTTNLT